MTLRGALVLLLWMVAAPQPAEAGAATVRVFAASSLTEVLRQVGVAYERVHPGERVEFSFGGSQVLRTQIEQGAPADVFAAADLAQMRPLQRAGIADRYRIFAHNRLIVVVAPGAGAVRTLEDLARPGVRLVLADSAVPAGRYTQQCLGKLTARYGSEFLERVSANVRSQEINVRQVLEKVALGEADAGIVYTTDAASVRGKVRTIPIPDHFNVVAAYPVAVISRSPVHVAAEAFVNLLTGRDGKTALRSSGFLP